MKDYVQIYKRLPAEARLLVGFVIVGALMILFQGLFPAGIFPWSMGGVVALFAVLISAHLLIRVRDRSLGKKLDSEISAQHDGPSRRELAEKEQEYKAKWLEGAAKLNKAGLSLYELPWFIIIGEPGGGKTMTLLNSGMDFPMGKDELPGFGGTRNYNWWFTNSAVILDTAGRLVFEQEGTSDRHEWESFLKLLKRRRRCPINGVIVALPCDKLLSDSAEQREKSASIIRDRLRQIQTQLDVRFPVSLLITKSDLIAGFTEFFNELDSVQRNQLFGWSRPGEFDAPYDPSEFTRDFDELYGQLHDLRLKFLARRTSDVEAGWIYTFPEAYRAMKDRVQDYVDVIFSKNIFAEPLFFRGFYFTSALQEGKPIIDILGEHLSGEELENLEGIFPQSRAFFIHDYYTQKVAKEQGMVFRSQKHISRMRLLKRSTIFLGLPLLLLLSVFAVLGYFTYNKTITAPRELVDKASKLIAQYKEAQEGGSVWVVEGAANADGGGDLADAIALSQSLSDEIDRVKHPEGLASIMFASIGADAERKIRAIQRELVGYCILRPEVVRVEQVLTDADVAITPQNIDDFAESLSTYLAWHFGDDAGSLEDLRAVLPERGFSNQAAGEQLELFSNDTESGLAGRLAGGITSDKQHRRRVIEAALTKAEAYWDGATDIGRHEAFSWWGGLLAKCDEVRESYEALLDMRQRFELASKGREFDQLAEEFLRAFPEGREGTTADVKLLEALRRHLQAPLRTGSRIVPFEELVTQHLDASKRFWEKCEAVVPTDGDAADRASAAEIKQRISDFRKSFDQKMQVTRQSYRARLAEIGDVLRQDRASDTPRFEFTESAEEVERILFEEASSRLSELASGMAPTVESWINRLQNLIKQPPPDLKFDLGPDWRTARLKRLIRAVADARNRFESRLVVDKMAEQLNAMPSQGLASFMDGQDDDDRARTLRFGGLKNRHAASFLVGTAKAKQALENALAKAVDRGLILQSDYLTELLEESMGRYVHHFLEAWGDAYDNYRMKIVDEFDLNRPTNWTAYRRWMHDHSTEVRGEYMDHVEAIIDQPVALFRAGGPGADDSIKQELRKHLDKMRWKGKSSFERVFEELVSSDQAPGIKEVERRWRRFEIQLDDFRFRDLDDLARARIEFPMLGMAVEGNDPLTGERLTGQLQYVVDYGEWLLWAEITRLLERKYFREYEKSRPFIFVGGKSANVDMLKLKSMLASLEEVGRFSSEQAPDSTSPSAPRGRWLGSVSRWAQWLRQDPIQIQVVYETNTETGPARKGPQEFYDQVVFRLQGLVSEDGSPKRELVFASGRPSDAGIFSWRPDMGRLTVALRGVSEEHKNLSIELEPRVLELARAEYGLIELLFEHGKSNDEKREKWVIQLEKDMREIQGLENIQTDDPVRWIVFAITFLSPGGGPPPQVDWPDADLLAGARPAPPWREDPNDR